MFSNQSDKKKRFLYNIYEVQYIEYKSMASNHLLLEKYKYNQKLTAPRNSSLVCIRNRCILSGRGRAVFRFCKLSRIILRDKARAGTLPGITKSSW